MKIERKTPQNLGVPFSKVKVGEVFEFVSEGIVQIKGDECITELGTGKNYENRVFSDSDLCRVLRAKLVIEE